MLTTALATKADLMAVENRLIERIANVRVDLIKWMMGGFIAQTALLVAILAFLR